MANVNSPTAEPDSDTIFKIFRPSMSARYVVRRALMQ